MSCVYAIEGVGSGLVKIGRAHSPARRLASLQTGSPLPLRLLCSTHETPEINESTLHQRFADFRVHGEWFAVAPEDVAAEVIGFGSAGA